MTEKEVTENYPKLGSGTKYYPKLSSYVNEGGLCFDYTKEMKIEEIQDLLNDVTINKVGECLLNNRENSPIKLTKKGVPYKKQKGVIDSIDYQGVLVLFKGVDPAWNDKTKEWVYFLTIDGFIVKIGMTITSLEERYVSYSCGYRTTMEKGTCSTTNFIICEVCYAALLSGKTVSIYGLEVEKETKEIEQYGRRVTIPISIVRGHEEIITSIYKENVGHIPPLCVQHAKNVD